MGGCFALLLLVLATGDPLVWGALKRLFGRARPFTTMPDVTVFGGRMPSLSMPSGHAANWFTATMVAYLLSEDPLGDVTDGAARWILRIYNGVHYPTDVLVGAVWVWLMGGNRLAGGCLLAMGRTKMVSALVPCLSVLYPSEADRGHRTERKRGIRR